MTVIRSREKSTMYNSLFVSWHAMPQRRAQNPKTIGMTQVKKITPPDHSLSESRTPDRLIVGVGAGLTVGIDGGDCATDQPGEFRSLLPGTKNGMLKTGVFFLSSYYRSPGSRSPVGKNIKGHFGRPGSFLWAKVPVRNHPPLNRTGDTNHRPGPAL